MSSQRPETEASGKISFVSAGDGCQIAVRTLRHGSKDLPPLLVIHALAMNGSMWSETAAHLKADVTVYAIDCRGHGLSDKPAGPYSTERFAKDILAVLDSLGNSRVALAGCSMGGTVAMAFAGRYPERIVDLCLVDTTAWYGEEAPANWERRAQTALSEGMAALVEFQLQRWFSPGFLETHPDVVARALDIFLANDTAAYAETCRMLGRADERERLTAYRGPARILVGENDLATPVAMAKMISEYLPQAKVEILPHVRHFTPYEIPSEISSQIEMLMGM